MVRYRRNRIAGGVYFFTAALADRRSTLLTDHISLLRGAFRQTRDERPFTIDAAVMLPDHLHAIWTLPQGDADYPGRWRRMKSLFTRAGDWPHTSLHRYVRAGILPADWGGAARIEDGEFGEPS